MCTNNTKSELYSKVPVTNRLFFFTLERQNIFVGGVGAPGCTFKLYYIINLNVYILNLAKIHLKLKNSYFTKKAAVKSQRPRIKQVYIVPGSSESYLTSRLPPLESITVTAVT